MEPFKVIQLTDSKTLSSIGDCQGSRFLAGGTNLIDLMKHQIETPVRLIDLSQWEASDKIEESDDDISVGAMVTNTELANFSAKHPALSVLAQALLSGATVQLRNRASTAGNLLQRTRCYYFYDTSKRCNKRVPGSGCDALQGFNRIHAVLGASEHCIASHPSDMAVAMTLLDAKVHSIDTAGSTRAIPVRELYRLPGSTPHIETCLKSDELITHVSIPKRSRGTHYYQKVRDRQSYAFALVSVACTLKLIDNKIEDVQIAFGGVGTQPWLATNTMAKLQGQQATTKNVENALDADLIGAKGAGRNDFKISLTKRTLKHVLTTVIQHQQSNPGYEGALYDHNQ
ncbi:xanthine dehydrogenase family protein subunit M [Aliiglaciecola sp. LCG003]|uniref:FAD binding domain-containing protein n=1 Tax=Aliiglaciecola sp. LCG003 TaxID=3053655 RepID=UPI002572E7C1|nr:xanthine dehydrogenase family protein subunit M [Aliiglaciecola sp. LCG003]WJG08091.1 xanthine dehydrogenase family protein subunit M [Aliiglaciecola sp. LCG003]